MVNLSHILRPAATALLLGLATSVFTADAQRIADTSTKIEHPDFYTLQWTLNDGDDQSPALITLGSDDRLTLSFDELSDDRRYMRYELIHCNAYWQPDNLVTPEYLDGFNEATIDNYAYSEATMTHYVHYSLTLPNDQMRLRLSGNYLVRVYDESAPDQTLLQARFSVVEPQMKIAHKLTSRTDIDYNDSHQQLNLGVDVQGVNVRSMFTDLIVSVEQNGRQDNIVYLTTPNRIAGTTAWYEHNPSLIFNAGNEYRRMEIVSTTYPGMHVEDLSFSDPFYHATLATDAERATLPYSYDETQHGRFRIREYNADDSDVESEYMLVHFELDIPQLTRGDIFVDGDLFQRRFAPQSRMVYNHATKQYELTALLKQGAYNYQYLYVPYGSMTGSTAQVEGDKYQTINQYLIKVYHRPSGERYDHLVGTTMVFSGL